MRSLVISALSRPRETSRRSVFMLTGTTSWTIGSTKAPPFITTFWPPRPVRTKARSSEERRYSQFINHTTIATTMAATTSPRIADPNCAPVMRAPCKACSDWGGAAPLLPQAPPPPCSFPRAPVRLRPHSSSRTSPADLLELAGRLGQRHLGRQPLHAGGAVEAVALPAMLQDEARVGGPGDRSAVAEHDDVLVHRAGGGRPRGGEPRAVRELERGLGADGAAGGEPEVADHDVGPRLGHVHRVLLREHVGGGEQVALVGRADHLDLEAVAHPGLLQLGADGPVEEADGGEVLHPGEAERDQPLQEVGRDHERIGAVDPREHRRPFHHREHLAGHVDHDVVRVAVGHQARQGPAASHAVPARVVDHDQVDAARLLALGGEAGARAAADDRLTAPDHGPELLEAVLTGDAGHGRAHLTCGRARAGSPTTSSKAATRASQKAWSLMLCGKRTSFRRGPARNPDAIASNSTRSAVGSQNGWPAASIRERPPSGIRNRTGPSIRLSFSTMKRPIRPHSSGVVRIRVTFGLCR